MKSSNSKITVLRCDLFISSTRLSFKLVAKKCVTFPDDSTKTAAMPALTLEDSGSKHASVKMKNTFEIDRWTVRRLCDSKHVRYNFKALMVSSSSVALFEQYACSVTIDNAFLQTTSKGDEIFWLSDCDSPLYSRNGAYQNFRIVDFF